MLEFGVIMEFMAGGSLEGLLDKWLPNGIASLTQLKNYLRQILTGL